MDAVDRHAALEIVTEPRILRTIHSVRLEELFLCIPLGHAFYEEAHLVGHFAPRVFIETWYRLLSSGAGEIVGLWKENVLLGALGGVCFPDPNTGRWMAQELFWFVAPEARQGTGAFRLYKAFAQWAQAHGATRLIMSALAGPYADRLGTLYQKLGFCHLETNYMKELT